MRIVPARPDLHEDLVTLALARSPHATRGEVVHPFEEPHEFPGLAVRAALDDHGTLLGWGAVARPSWNPPGAAVFLAHVAAAHEGRGVGSTLRQALWDRLPEATTTVRTRVFDDEPRAAEIARHWGFTVEEHSISSRRPLGDLVAPEPGPGVSLESNADQDFTDPDAVEAMLAASQTNPEARAGLALRLDHMRHPTPPARSVLVIARVDGVPAALTWGVLAEGSFYVAYSGVDPAYRGRGLAALVKQHAAVEAQAAGATEALTSNEEHNTGIRRINAELGYIVRNGVYRMVGPVPAPS